MLGKIGIVGVGIACKMNLIVGVVEHVAPDTQIIPSQELLFTPNRLTRPAAEKERLLELN